VVHTLLATVGCVVEIQAWSHLVVMGPRRLTQAGLRGPYFTATVGCVVEIQAWSHLVVMGPRRLTQAGLRGPYFTRNCGLCSRNTSVVPSCCHGTTAFDASRLAWSILYSQLWVV
jgi:hypothetical protein